MKRLIILVFFIGISNISLAQSDTSGLNLLNKDGHIVFETIVEVNGKSRVDLYKNAKQWFVNYFKSSKDVIQSEDKEEGQIIGKGLINLTVKAGFGMTVNYHDKLSIQVDCKDNKYRFRVYNMIIYPPNMQEIYAHNLEDFQDKLLGTYKMPGTKGQIRSIIESNSKEVKLMIASFDKAMLSKSDTF